MKQVVFIFEGRGDVVEFTSTMAPLRVQHPFLYIAWRTRDSGTKEGVADAGWRSASRSWVDGAFGQEKSVWELAIEQTVEWELETEHKG